MSMYNVRPQRDPSRLYSIPGDLTCWVAYDPEMGWVRFFAAPGGWERRQAVPILGDRRLDEASPIGAMGTGWPHVRRTISGGIVH